LLHSSVTSFNELLHLLAVIHPFLSRLRSSTGNRTGYAYQPTCRCYGYSPVLP
jgi:hypothetical protein